MFSAHRFVKLIPDSETEMVYLPEDGYPFQS